MSRHYLSNTAPTATSYALFAYLDTQLYPLMPTVATLVVIMVHMMLEVTRGARALPVLTIHGCSPISRCYRIGCIGTTPLGALHMLWIPISLKRILYVPGSSENQSPLEPMTL